MGKLDNKITQQVLQGIYATVLVFAIVSIVMMMVHAYQLEQIHDDLTTLHHEYLKSKIELQLDKLNE